jgi:hypothetical protein
VKKSARFPARNGYAAVACGECPSASTAGPRSAVEATGATALACRTAAYRARQRVSAHARRLRLVERVNAAEPHVAELGLIAGIARAAAADWRAAAWVLERSGSLLETGERLFAETNHQRPFRLVETRTVDDLVYLMYETVRVAT